MALRPQMLGASRMTGGPCSLEEQEISHGNQSSRDPSDSSSHTEGNWPPWLDSRRPNRLQISLCTGEIDPLEIDRRLRSCRGSSTWLFSLLCLCLLCRQCVPYEPRKDR